ncbi:hypothetical protein NC653_011427 [Populus alba x Populus x berolinensis]|uniref:Uncharacterized protein n=1 Tax=Populus alba x Populus x berolinensis TaxID=444605 RepID=A0AAD6W6C8_9ROSI|nr:hypothetical protein NC653_011427 [Populus alba x Populus x berolinensis]
MIMLDLLSDLPFFINILFPDGGTLKQSVFFYEFLLKFCKHCRMQGHIGLICPKVVIGEEVNSDTPMKARKKHISPSSLDPLMKAVAMDVNSGNQSVPQSDFPSSSKVVAAIVIVSDNAATSREKKKAKLSFTSISPA